MKAHWEYESSHAEERRRMESRDLPVTGRLAASMVLLLAFSVVIFSIFEAIEAVYEPATVILCGGTC